jgi:hypothetical protein
VQAVDRMKNRAVNETRRWSEEFSPDSGPAGQSDRPMGMKKPVFKENTPDGKYGGGR